MLDPRRKTLLRERIGHCQPIHQHHTRSIHRHRHNRNGGHQVDMARAGAIVIAASYVGSPMVVIVGPLLRARMTILVMLKQRCCSTHRCGKRDAQHKQECKYSGEERHKPRSRQSFLYPSTPSVIRPMRSRSG